MGPKTNRQVCSVPRRQQSSVRPAKRKASAILYLLAFLIGARGSSDDLNIEVNKLITDRRQKLPP